jgi:hypothetical protein
MTQVFNPKRYALQYLDPETLEWVTCETGPLVVIAKRLGIARAAPGNILTWRGTSKW